MVVEPDDVHDLARAQLHAGADAPGLVDHLGLGDAIEEQLLRRVEPRGSRRVATPRRSFSLTSGTRPEDPSPRAAKSRPHASLKMAARVRERHSRTCPACPAYGACRVAAARASATHRCRQRATYRWRSQPSASSRVDPLALGAEDGERFGRAVDGPKPVRGAAGELGGLAGLEDEVVVAEHEPEPA